MVLRMVLPDRTEVPLAFILTIRFSHESYPSLYLTLAFGRVLTDQLDGNTVPRS